MVEAEIMADGRDSCKGLRGRSSMSRRSVEGYPGAYSPESLVFRVFWGG